MRGRCASPIPLTVERASYFSSLSPSPSQSPSLFLVFFLFTWFLGLKMLVVSSISLCLFYDSFKGKGKKISFDSTWHKILQQRRAHGEGFGQVARSQVRVPQYAPSDMARLYFKQRSELCSFHFQRAWMGLWGALKSRGGESLHSCSPMPGETGLAVDVSACLWFPLSCPWEHSAWDLHKKCKRAWSWVIISLQTSFSLPWNSLTLALLGWRMLKKARLLFN